MKHSTHKNSENKSHLDTYSNSNLKVELAQMEVYNELADQTTTKVDLISQIQSQLSQLQLGLAKRNFMAKEISTYIIKD